MWTQHNPRVPLGAIAMISKGFYWQIHSTIICIEGFPFSWSMSLSRSNSKCCFKFAFNHAFINVKGKINFVPEIDIAFDHLQHIEKPFATNWEPPELSLYIHLNQCAGVLSNTLKQTSKIYSKWSWQLI